MAQAATMHVFDIRLADADRAVNETLTIRAAQPPSATADYLLTRLLAYCLEYTEGIAFAKGLSNPDEPAVVVRDLTGVLQAWIEVGAPDAERLHRAAKAAPPCPKGWESKPPVAASLHRPAQCRSRTQRAGSAASFLSQGDGYEEPGTSVSRTCLIGTDYIANNCSGRR